MSSFQKPLLAITMGDPAGVGPEIIVRAWQESTFHDVATPFVIGHPAMMHRAAELFGRNTEIVAIESSASIAELEVGPRLLPCLSTSDDDVLGVLPGRVDPRAGEAAFQCVRRAAELALAGEIDGLVTAPLSKSALHAAGHRYPGHTELLAEICGVTDFAMMLYLTPGDVVVAPAGLGVAHVTLHQSLRSVFEDLTPTAIHVKCHLADQVMRRLGVERPRIGVCAINPHAGEDGLFGDEEARLIAPAVAHGRADGLNVSGPFPTDTLMVRARDGEFDAVVAIYHDQGHIALKLLDMHGAVNITLGLPIVRTSVAHGTAFDRAWQGTARTEGMAAALFTAAKLIRNKAM